MEMAVKDKGGVWYRVSNDMYHCINSKGKVVGRLARKYVPDPHDIWFKRCKAAGISTSQLEAKLLKPNQVVYKLWEHANA